MWYVTSVSRHKCSGLTASGNSGRIMCLSCVDVRHRTQGWFHDSGSMSNRGLSSWCSGELLGGLWCKQSPPILPGDELLAYPGYSKSYAKNVLCLYIELSYALDHIIIDKWMSSRNLGTCRGFEAIFTRVGVPCARQLTSLLPIPTAPQNRSYPRLLNGGWIIRV